MHIRSPYIFRWTLKWIHSRMAMDGADGHGSLRTSYVDLPEILEHSRRFIDRALAGSPPWDPFICWAHRAPAPWGPCICRALLGPFMCRARWANRTTFPKLCAFTIISENYILEYISNASPFNRPCGSSPININTSVSLSLSLSPSLPLSPHLFLPPSPPSLSLVLTPSLPPHPPKPPCTPRPKTQRPTPRPNVLLTNSHPKLPAT